MAVLSRTSTGGQPAAGDAAQNESADALQTLSALLTSHRSHLLSLYTTLGHVNPQAHVSTKITALHSSLIATVQGQAKEAEDEVEGLKKEAESVEASVRRSRQRLGTPEATLNEGLDASIDKNLLVRLERLKKLEAGLAEVTEARQAQIKVLNERLQEYIPVLGETEVKKALDGEDRTEGDAGEEDLSLARIQRLEGEVQKCDAEIVGLSRPSFLERRLTTRNRRRAGTRPW